jgi:hypothetical protein
VYCCYVITLANEVLAFNQLLDELNLSWWRRSIILLTCVLSLKQSVNQLHLNGTIGLTISQPVFSFSYYAWKQSNMVHEESSAAIYHLCRQLVYCVVAWSGNNQDSCLHLRCLSPAFYWSVKSWTLPQYGSWLWIMSAGIIALIKKQECRHQQDDCASVFLLAPVIVTITFWWLLVICNIIAILGSGLSLKVMYLSRCDFITINITVSCD